MLYPEQKRTLWQRLGRCYPLVMEVVPLFLVGLTVHLVASNYSTLPDTIPSHFNAQGVSDDWASTNTIFLYRVIVFPIYIFLSILTACMSAVKDPKSLSLPAITEAKAE